MNIQNKIQTKAVLVTLKIGSLPSLKRDKASATKIEIDNGAKVGKASTASKYIIDKDFVKPHTNAVAKARAVHYKLTNPWVTEGTGVLPREFFTQYQNDIQAARDEILKEGKAVLDKYDEIIADAQVRLGNLFDPSQMPSRREIERKIYCDVRFAPLPEKGHFVMDAAADIIDEVAESIDASYKDAAMEQNRTIARKIKEAVEKIHEKTTGEGGIFRDSLINNLDELLQILPTLNVFDDSVINDIIQDAKNLVVEPEHIRKDAIIREDVNTKAKGILDKLDSFI